MKIKAALMSTKHKQDKILERGNNIVDLYNDHFGCNEELGTDYPDRIKVIKVHGDNGGVVLDEFHYSVDGTDIKMPFIIFAAFEPKNRGKGMLKASLKEAAKQGIDIQAVEIDAGQAADIWAHFGFTHLGCLSMRVFASKKPLRGASPVVFN